MKINKLFILSFFAIILSCFIFTACNSVDTNEADVTDETFLSPEEQTDQLTGTWTAQADELTVNRYFYGDGKLVTIIQDPEEETTCLLSTWSQDGDKITFTSLEEYEYDESNGTWNKESIDSTATSATKTSNDTFVSDETLPDGVQAHFEFKRGLAKMSIPGSTDLLGYINAFLGH